MRIVATLAIHPSRPGRWSVVRNGRPENSWSLDDTRETVVREIATKGFIVHDDNTITCA